MKLLTNLDLAGLKIPKTLNLWARKLNKKSMLLL